MSQERDRALAIQLDDGRVVVATPKPEDQDRLAKLDKDIVFLTASGGDYDTSGHGYGDLLELDVEGHAITLRMPSPADAEAVRRALAVGAVTSTIVAAGAIAALHGTQAPALPQAAAPPAITDVRTLPMPHARPDFQNRKEAATDVMLNSGPATVTTSEAAPAAPALPKAPAITQANPLPVPQARPDFRDRKDAAAEDTTSGGSASDLPAVNQDSKYK